MEKQKIEVDGQLTNAGEVVLKINKKPARESGLELLRIIAMILIVMHHVNIFGGITTATSWGENLKTVCGACGKLGVNIFVLISAYFMVNKKFKLTRVLNIVIQATFYSILFYILSVAFRNVNFTFRGFVYWTLAVFYSEWWFVTTYIYLLLLAPALNIILHSMPKKTLGYSIIGMVAFSVLFPYFNRLILGKYIETPSFNSLFVFIELYLIGGYIRLYGIKLKKVWIVLITLATFIFGIILTYFGDWREMGWQLSSISNFVCAIGLLLIFKDFKFKSRIVNSIAATTFGIYLIHENSFMRNWEYNFLKNTFFPWVNSSALIFLLLTLTIFVICMIVDFLRLQTVHRLTNRALKYIDKKIEDRKLKKEQTQCEEKQPL